MFFEIMITALILLVICAASAFATTVIPIGGKRNTLSEVVSAIFLKD